MKKRILSLILILTTVSSLCSFVPLNVSAETYSPVATIDWNGHTYHLYDETVLGELDPFWNSNSFCINLGGRLAEISSQEENNIINELISKGNFDVYFVGGYRNIYYNEWNWLYDSVAFSYTNWDFNEPDISDSNSIVYTLGINSVNKKWIAVNPNNLNNTKKYGFICEFDTQEIYREKSKTYSITSSKNSEQINAFSIVGSNSYLTNEYIGRKVNGTELNTSTIHIEETATLKCLDNMVIEIYSKVNNDTILDYGPDFKHYIFEPEYIGYAADGRLLPKDYALESGIYYIAVYYDNTPHYFKLNVDDSAKEKPISVYLNNNKLKFDVPPIIEDGRTLIPLRALFEYIEAEVDWNNDTKTITITQNSWDDVDITKIITMKVGDTKVNYVIVDVYEENITLDVPPKIIDDSTLIPLRFITETLGYDVNWVDETRSIYLTSSPLANNVTNNLKGSDIYCNPLFNGMYSWGFDNAHIGWTNEDMEKYLTNQEIWGDVALTSLAFYDVSFDEIPDIFINRLNSMVDYLVAPNSSDLTSRIESEIAKTEMMGGMLDISTLLKTTVQLADKAGVYEKLGNKVKQLIGANISVLGANINVLDVYSETAAEALTIQAILEISEENRIYLKEFLANLPAEKKKGYEFAFELIEKRLNEYDNYSYGAMLFENGLHKIVENVVDKVKDIIHNNNSVEKLFLDIVRVGIDIVAADQLNGIKDAGVFSALYDFQDIALDYYTDLWEESKSYSDSIPLDFQRKIKNAAVISMISSNRARDMFIKHRKELWFGDDGRECDQEGYNGLIERNEYIEAKFIKRWKTAIVE